jgi:tetratricopeptide (TPR) repeat protein
LEPLRQYARSRLERRGEVSITHERHSAFFLGLFEEAEQEFLKQFATPSLVNRMDGELGNLRVALRWLIAGADVGRAQRLAGAARTLWLQRAYLDEGRRWLEEALALDPPACSPKEPAARARALLGLLGIALHEGDLAGAETAGHASLHLLEELRDTARAAGALRFLGLVADARTDLARARRIMEQALVASRETGQLAPAAVSLCQIAELDLEEGDLVAAQRHAEEALEIVSAAGNVAISFRALVNLGEVERRLGRRDAAQRIWEVALTRLRGEPRQHSSILPALITLGRYASGSDDARSCLTEGLLLTRDGRRWDLARGLEVVVEVASAEGRPDLALQLAGAAAALRDRIGARLWPSDRARVEVVITHARQELTQEVADTAWMQGWASTVDQTLARALNFLQGVSVASARSHLPTGV